MFAWAFICVVIVAWIGYSAYAKVTGAKENVVQNTVMDTTALDNYISNMTTDATMMQTAQMLIQQMQNEDTTASEDTDSEDTVTDDTATDTEETADDKESTDDTASQMTQRQKVQILLLQTAQTLNKINFYDYKKAKKNPRIIRDFLRFNPYLKVRNSILSRY